MNKLIQNPFIQLDGYNKEAFTWAQEMTSVIDISKFIEKDPLIISVAFARIFDVFIHLAMSYNLTDFGSYFDENIKKTIPDSWRRVLICTNEIYSALMTVYKDSMKLYLTLYDSILIQIEDDGYDYDDNKLHPIKVEPQPYNEDAGFGFVSGGFGY